MVSRVLLGCGTVGQRLVDVLSERGDLRVVCDDRRQVETLRSEHVRAEHADPTDPDVARRAVEGATSVLIASDDTADNLTIAEQVRTVAPDRPVVAVAGWRSDDETVARLADLVDDLIRPERSVASAALGHIVGEGGTQIRGLRRVLRRLDGPLAVVMHDNPDPDAIASAVALCRIAGTVGLDADPCYFGSINHQENRALVNLLDLDLVNFDSTDELEGYGSFALVDHSRPGVNDQLPEDLSVDVVIDHHPPRAPVSAGFVDLRSDVGSTSTLMTEYLTGLGVEVDDTVATALLFGIRVDTDDFSREVSEADFQAAATLLPHIDTSILDRVESPSLSTDTLDTLARAIDNRERRGSVLSSCVGAINDRDTLAQAADQLLNMEDVTASLVYGYRDGVIYISARTRGTDIDMGETLRMAFDQIGSAGGHADMAGGQIPIGMLVEDEEDDEEITEVVRDLVTDRFFDTLRKRPGEAAVDYLVDIAPSVRSGDAGGQLRAGPPGSDEDRGSERDDSRSR